MRHWHTPEFFGLEWSEWKSDELHIVFTMPENMEKVRQEIWKEQPDYPVMLRQVFAPKYGIRASGVEFRYIDWGRYNKERAQQWYNYEVLTLVHPSSVVPLPMELS